MFRTITMAAVAAALMAAGCDGATARLALANQTTAARTQALLADGTSLRLVRVPSGR